MIFGGEKKSKQQLISVNNAGMSFIANGTIIKGNINAQSEIFIEGQFEGEILSQSTVVIGENGKGKGTIQANRMVVNGVFEGESECEIIEIMASGRHNGEIIVNELVIERGGSFVGNSRKKTNKELPNGK